MLIVWKVRFILCKCCLDRIEDFLLALLSCWTNVFIYSNLNRLAKEEALLTSNDPEIIIEGFSVRAQILSNLIPLKPVYE